VGYQDTHPDLANPIRTKRAVGAALVSPALAGVPGDRSSSLGWFCVGKSHPNRDPKSRRDGPHPPAPQPLHLTLKPSPAAPNTSDRKTTSPPSPSPSPANEVDPKAGRFCNNGTASAGPKMAKKEKWALAPAESRAVGAALVSPALKRGGRHPKRPPVP